jgi:serine/threonine protein kinase
MSLTDYYREYTCSYNNPLNCDRPLQTAQSVKGAKFCLECAFPAILEEKAEIKGSRGSYQIISLLETRGLGRLYSGIHLQNKQPVIIKEYLLPTRSFNDDETSKRKETFKRVAGVNLADGRNQNFRITNYFEAIVDENGERCYLITNEIEPSQTLSKYLIEKGAMTPSAVRGILNQALQTLEFLHTQKLRLPSNQIRHGLAHGNINLDSILIKEEKNNNFYIYFCDLALWENLFIPPSIPQSAPAKPEDDLKSLGLVAFYLWMGRVTDDSTHQYLNPRDTQQWPNNDSHLKQYLYNLIGLDAPFESAQVARQVLLQLPIEENVNKSKASSTTEAEKKRFRRIPLFILIFLALLLLGGGMWFLFGKFNKYQEESTEWNQLPEKFSDITGVQAGTFFFTGEKQGTWSSVWEQSPIDNKRLKDLIRSPIPSIQAIFDYKPIETDTQSLSQFVSKPLDKLRTENKYSFVITNLQDENITDDLDKKPIAYDGLLVFVESAKGDGNLPTALGGEISLEDLRLIYTGKTTNWAKLKGRNLDIIPRIPMEPEAIRLFQKIVFKDNKQDIADFKKIVLQEETTKTIREIGNLVETKGNSGIISFGIFSKTWDQCGIYPLDIKVNDSSSSSQPMFNKVSRRQVTPSTYSCGKDNYLDTNTVKSSYLLGYPLYVVYPRNNKLNFIGSSFADVLSTRQGQCLLNEVGLAPLQPMPKNYVCKSLP